MLCGGPLEIIKSISFLFKRFRSIRLEEKVDKTLESGIKKFERINTSSLFQKLLFVLVNMSEGTFLLNKDLYILFGSIRSLLMISNRLLESFCRLRVNTTGSQPNF